MEKMKVVQVPVKDLRPYCDVIIQRWENMTGEAAQRAA
jgi:hypothetical protein